MNKFKLNSVFKEIKKKAKMDYAVPTPDKYGDCSTCVNSELVDQFGVDSTGIYAKHWVTGMNAGGPWKYLNEVHIGHYITEEQAKIMIEVLEANGYAVEPREYNPIKSFLIKEEHIK
jgi:hypothetical protein